MNLKKNGKVFTIKSVGTGPSSYEKRIYRAAVSQRLRNTGLHDNTQQSQEKDIHASGGIRTRNLSRWTAADIHLRQRGLWNTCKWLNIHPEASNCWQRQFVVFRVATVQSGKFSGGNCRLQLLNRGLISNTAGTKHAKVTSPVVCIKSAVPGWETQSTV